MKERGEGCGVRSLQSVLEGNENSLHSHLELEEAFVYVTLIFVDCPTYIEKTRSVPGVVISTGCHGLPHVITCRVLDTWSTTPCRLFTSSPVIDVWEPMKICRIIFWRWQPHLIGETTEDP